MKHAGRYSLKYFNGFSLQGEEQFFKPWLIESDYAVAGFSHGAQLALEHALQSSKRIDRLLLFSPAFFQNQKPAFIRVQLRYFDAGHKAYVSQFLKNVAYPSSIDLENYLDTDSKAELEALLTYRWEDAKLKALQEKGTVIEVFLGAKDKIIDAEAARDFFAPLATTYWFKEAGHLLQS